MILKYQYLIFADFFKELKNILIKENKVFSVNWCSWPYRVKQAKWEIFIKHVVQIFSKVEDVYKDIPRLSHAMSEKINGQIIKNLLKDFHSFLWVRKIRNKCRKNPNSLTDSPAVNRVR